MRLSLCLLIALMLGGCAAGGSGGYSPDRCDRNGDELQRRSC